MEKSVVRSEHLSRFPEICCAMSTRKGGVSSFPYGMNLSYQVGDDRGHVEENRRRFFSALDIPVDRLAIPKQCHSKSVAVVREPGSYPETDGLLTDTPDVWLIVSVADCTPVFLYDPERRAVAGLHAGWRGSSKGIVASGVETMIREFGSNPGDLKVFVGPSAGSCCYEVGDEVAMQFGDGVVSRRDGKTFIDLKKENVRQLVEGGVPLSNIEVSPHCTICGEDLFHSFRRDRERSGRMMGVIGLRG